jgi:hypothetical protein
MDLSGLSDADFKALQAGRLDAMSDQGFGVLIKQQNSSMSLPEKIAQQRSIIEEKSNPTNNMSGPAIFAAGAGKAVADTGRGISQLMGRTSREDIDASNSLDAPLMATKLGRAGNLTGNVGLFAPTAAIPGANTITGSAVLGGALGALQPVGTEDNRMNNALWGAGGGALATGAANALSRVMAPKPPQGTRDLVDAGITLTPGQRLGGAWKRAEDGLTSVPVLGDVIKNAQRRTFGEMNDVIANKALEPLGVKLPSGTRGRDAVAFVEKTIGDKYDNALSGIKSVSGDSQFGNEIASLQTMVHNSPLPKDVQQQFDQIIRNQIAGKFQGQNSMTAQTFKDVESELGRLATKYGADASADKQLLGDAIQETQAALRSLLERSAGPQYAGEVKAANAAWAQFKRLQRASTSLGAEDGVFNPEQYLNAVKALDKSKDKSAFARGDALNQGLAEDAKRVMGNKVPDSGTPFRSLVTNPLQGLISSAGAIPASLWKVGPYSESGQAVWQALLNSNRPASVSALGSKVKAAAPYLGLAGSTNALANRSGQ